MNVNSSRVGIASASQDTCKNIIFHLGLWGKEQTENGREKEKEDFRLVRVYVCDYHLVLVQVLASGFHNPQSQIGLLRKHK